VSDRRQIRAHPARPLTVACPICRAGVGKECLRGDHYPRRASFHPARFTAANDQYLEEAAERRRLDREARRHERYAERHGG